MNDKFDFTPEEQKLYNCIVKGLYESMMPVIEKEEEKRKEYKVREKIHQEIQRQKYLESLTPITKDEFIARMKNVIERYKNFLMYRKQESILFCSLDLNFPQILGKAKAAKNGLELAEIVDKAEKTMMDMENIKNIVVEDTEVIHKEIEKRKKQKILNGVIRNNREK